MKNFYQYLAPFAPDYSGAAAVFCTAGALTVLCDPGGCSGNVCGYDEPRFYENGAALYSAALRDMDTIFGKDEKLAEKIVSAAACGDFKFIALVGTPVVSVIATDLEALCRIVEERTGIRTVSVDTNGMELYDVGERKARKVIEKNFSGLYEIGYTPLDSMPDKKNITRISDELKEAFANEDFRKKKILIIHQKDAADTLKNRLKTEGVENIVSGSWFRGCDLQFDDEELFIQECMKYDAVIADPLYFRALEGFKGVKIAFPHLAVSGDLFAEM